MFKRTDAYNMAGKHARVHARLLTLVGLSASGPAVFSLAPRAYDAYFISIPLRAGMKRSMPCSHNPRGWSDWPAAKSGSAADKTCNSSLAVSELHHLELNACISHRMFGGRLLAGKSAA